eukprot:6468678-Amphidinium_carterae.1
MRISHQEGSIEGMHAPKERKAEYAAALVPLAYAAVEMLVVVVASAKMPTSVDSKQEDAIPDLAPQMNAQLVSTCKPCEGGN